MLPECGRFVTAIKLNRGLRDSNYDQLFAYLKQHEAHAKENKMMLERLSQPTTDPLSDPLALLSNNVHGRPNRGQGMNPRGGSASGYGEAQNRVENVNQGQARTAQENGVALDAEQLLFLAGGQDNAFDDDVDEQPVQDLALNVDNVFQAKDCDAFDSDVDEAPTAQTMFMDNLSSADPITDEAGPSYDSDILSEYVKDNEVLVVHSNASSIPNDTFMMIYNDMCEPLAPSVSNSSRNAVVKNFLTAELALIWNKLN
nr:hypothetical protein [Tanacetum cinerariifolium]